MLFPACTTAFFSGAGTQHITVVRDIIDTQIRFNDFFHVTHLHSTSSFLRPINMVMCNADIDISHLSHGRDHCPANFFSPTM
jgi:hypothetical protein